LKRAPKLCSNGYSATISAWTRLLHQALPHEVFVVLYLDAQNRVIGSEELFRGTLTQTTVYPREVVNQVYPFARGALFSSASTSLAAGPTRFTAAANSSLLTPNFLLQHRIW
jgi:DNA repair protein RadC